MPQHEIPTVPRTKIALAVVEHAGGYLIGRRPPNVPLAGLWEFPGGKVQANETPAEAAARECLEETGVSVRVGREHPPIQHDYTHDPLELHFFHCTPVDAAAQPREPFRWVEAGDLVALEFPPANRAILDEIAAAL
jgi:mutator protein MutT